MKKPLTNAEHQQVARNFRLLHQYARKVMSSTRGRYAKSHTLGSACEKLELTLTNLQGELDAAYHEVSSDADFDKQGHVYHNQSLLKGTSMDDDIWYYAFRYALGRSSEIVYKTARLMIDEWASIGPDTREQIITDILAAGKKDTLGSKEYKRYWTFVVLQSGSIVLDKDGEENE